MGSVGNGGDTPAACLSPSEQQEAASSTWHDLPADIVGRLMRQLGSLDGCALLGAVCRDWRASVRQHWRRRTPAPAYLALPGGGLFRFPEFTSRYLGKSAGYCGVACEDSLVFTQDGGDDPRLRLENPFTGRTRLLPSLSGVIRGGDDNGERPRSRSWWRDDAEMTAVRKMVVCPDGTVAAIVGREHFARVAIFSPRSSAWRLPAHDRWRWYQDLAFCDGRLYALTGGEDLLAFDVGDGDDAGTGTGAAERVIEGALPRHSMSAARYLVRSRASGALLMVRRHAELAHQKTAPVSVFRADLAASRWVEVRDLGGGEALFVGRLCSRAVPARGAVQGDAILFAPEDSAGKAFWKWDGRGVTMASSHSAAVYDMRNGTGTVDKVMPRETGTDGSAPPTWLFPDSDDDWC